MLRLDHNDVLDLWVNHEIFCEYLDEAHGLEVPEPLMLQKFAPVVSLLVACLMQTMENRR